MASSAETHGLCRWNSDSGTFLAPFDVQRLMNVMRIHEWHTTLMACAGEECVVGCWHTTTNGSEKIDCHTFMSLDYSPKQLLMAPTLIHAVVI